MTDVNDRIMLIMQSLNITKVELAKVINVNPSGLSHIASKRNKPSVDMLISLLTAYPKISSEWLLLGKGAMYKEGMLSNLSQTLQDSLTQILTMEEINHQNLVNKLELLKTQLKSLV